MHSSTDMLQAWNSSVVLFCDSSRLVISHTRAQLITDDGTASFTMIITCTIALSGCIAYQGSDSAYWCYCVTAQNAVRLWHEEEWLVLVHQELSVFHIFLLKTHLWSHSFWQQYFCMCHIVSGAGGPKCRRRQAGRHRCRTWNTETQEQKTLTRTADNSTKTELKTGL